MSVSLSPYNYSYTSLLFTSLQPQTSSTGLSASDTVSILDATLQVPEPQPAATPDASVMSGMAQQMLNATFGAPALSGTQPIPGFPVAANPYDPTLYQAQVTGTLLNALI
ncbi:MAG: hypothetical protein ACM3XM_01735 [Mycobacterium leprae]